MDGSWERPIVMTEQSFRHKCKSLGHCWWLWEIFDNELPDIDEMLEEVEYRIGSFNLSHSQPAILLREPIYRIAKYKTKSGRRTLVRQYHLPMGNSYDQRITRQKSLAAFQMIQKGMGVADSLKRVGINWNALVRYSPYEPVRKKTHQRVKEVIDQVKKGNSLRKSLSQVRMSSKTFWERTGGITKILTHPPVSVWEIKK